MRQNSKGAMVVTTKVCDKNPREVQHVGSKAGQHRKLNAKECPRGEKEKAEMRKVPYASTVGKKFSKRVGNEANGVPAYI